HSIRRLSAQQVAGDHLEPALDLLSSMQYLAARLVQGGLAELLSDFDRVRARWPGDDSAELQPIRRALELAGHILDRDPAQLAGPFLGRLRPGAGGVIRGWAGAPRVSDRVSWRGRLPAASTAGTTH